MKQIILSLSLVFLFVFCACKKDFTCECTTENPLGGNDFVVPYNIEKAKKKQAEEACAAKEAESENTTCTLK